jgi:hypothetical protein
MKNQSPICKSYPWTRLFKATFRASILPASLLLLSGPKGHAASATWNLNPAGDDWNTAANWTPATVPNGPDKRSDIISGHRSQRALVLLGRERVHHQDRLFETNHQWHWHHE